VKRRDFVTLLGGAAAAWPLAARGQQLSGRTAHIGILQPSLDDPIVGRGYPAFLDELKTSGFVAGQNLTIEIVRTDQDARGLFAETADLVRSNVELLVVEGNETALQAAMGASPTIPIVIWANNFDPIARGYVKSLAQPGGNITGITSLQTELAGKQVELLTQAFPERTRLAVLYDGLSADQFTAAEQRARSLRLDVRSLKMENPPYDFDVAFRTLAESSPQMLLVLSSPFFSLSARISRS
jgi:putative tryptophan/tyrosine transport system substrate-binding protein